MKCIEFKSAIERSIEQRTALESSALEHLEVCFECRNVWELQNRVDEALAVWRSFQPPAPPVEAVLAALRQDSLDCQPLTADTNLKTRRVNDLEPPNRALATPTASILRRHKRIAITLATSSVACAVLASISLVIFQRFDVARQVDHVVKISTNRHEVAVIGDLKSEIANEVSELVVNAQEKLDLNTIESHTARSDIMDTGSQHVATLISSVAKDSGSRAIPPEIEHRGNPVVDRFKRGFGFLLETF